VRWRHSASARTQYRAEMDVIVGLTACSAEMSNNGAFKPIEYDIERRHIERPSGD